MIFLIFSVFLLFSDFLLFWFPTFLWLLTFSDFLLFYFLLFFFLLFFLFPSFPISYFIQFRTFYDFLLFFSNFQFFLISYFFWFPTFFDFLLYKKKSCIGETLNLLTCADSCSNTKEKRGGGFVQKVTCHLSPVTCHMSPTPTAKATDSPSANQGCIKRVSSVSRIQDRLTLVRQLASKRLINQAGPKAQFVLN